MKGFVGGFMAGFGDSKGFVLEIMGLWEDSLENLWEGGWMICRRLHGRIQ